VLGSQVFVVEPLRLLSGEVHDLLGAVGETIKHVVLGYGGSSEMSVRRKLYRS
jgi:hypothetical protein